MKRNQVCEVRQMWILAFKKNGIEVLYVQGVLS